MSDLQAALEPRWGEMANAIRFLAADAVENAGSGHPGMPLGMADLATGLFTFDELKRFRKAHARAAGHPEYGYFPGIEMTTGLLGQGFATSVGMAIAERMLAAEFGTDLVDHRTRVFCGDGCLMEGVSQEARSLAGHLGLSKLT